MTNRRRRLSDEEIRRELIDYCDIRGRVVDFGCGQGYWHEPLAERCTNIVAIDNYQTALDDVKKRNLPKVNAYLAGDLTHEPDQSADFILGIGLLQLLKRGYAWHDFFAQANRILVDGGRVLVDVPTPRHLAHMFLSLEGLRNIPKHGVAFGLDRQLGWLRYWLKGLVVQRIERGQRYYVVKPHVVERLAAEHGFEIAKGPNEILRDTGVWGYSGIYNPNPERPRYAWWLFRKERQISS